jgi:hypothetical protein
VIDLLAIVALMVLPSLHGLPVNSARKKVGGQYLEGSSSGNSLMSKGSMITRLNLVVGIPRFIESEHFDIREVSSREEFRQLIEEKWVVDTWVLVGAFILVRDDHTK